MTLTDVIPIAVGVGNAAATGYFWLVRANRERPRLAVHLLNAAEVQAARVAESGEWDATVEVRLAVVNQSTLPNIVLGFRAWLGAGGEWKEAVLAGVSTEAFNLPSQQAGFVQATVALVGLPRPAMPDAEWAGLSWNQALARVLGGPVRLKVEAVALNDRRFGDVFELPSAV